jgi:hypothetical protein
MGLERVVYAPHMGVVYVGARDWGLGTGGW